MTKGPRQRQIFAVKRWCQEVNSGTVGSSKPELTLHGPTANSNLFSRNGYWELLLQLLWKYNWQTPRHQGFHHCPWYVGLPHFSPCFDYANLSSLSEKLPLCFWEMLATGEFLLGSDLPQSHSATERILFPAYVLMDSPPTSLPAGSRASQTGTFPSFFFPTFLSVPTQLRLECHLDIERPRPFYVRTAKVWSFLDIV